MLARARRWHCSRRCRVDAGSAAPGSALAPRCWHHHLVLRTRGSAPRRPLAYRLRAAMPVPIVQRDLMWYRCWPQNEAPNLVKGPHRLNSEVQPAQKSIGNPNTMPKIPQRHIKHHLGSVLWVGGGGRLFQRKKTELETTHTQTHARARTRTRTHAHTHTHTHTHTHARTHARTHAH